MLPDVSHTFSVQSWLPLTIALSIPAQRRHLIAGGGVPGHRRGDVAIRRVGLKCRQILIRRPGRRASRRRGCCVGQDWPSSFWSDLACRTAALMSSLCLIYTSPTSESIRLDRAPCIVRQFLRLNCRPTGRKYPIARHATCERVAVRA